MLSPASPHPQPLSQAWERGARREQEGSKREARESSSLSPVQQKRSIS
ncbi:hypothetical protein MC7420_3954 [Coleofasciculus chthonoplastes PCC 7420]|uniref:Uncharacterized protein n=1 Tax=Coleofasciculus chthonoplastes PCC 7420 TaxID=118168 RepID=B4VUQ0_9CYAN|nr:hypothetical protein MC7420_3954 [Coleofasciculus chthonoplastes PCC 7420]